MASSEGLHAEVGVESLSQERRGPGRSLQQARERCRLTVASIADTLHLEQRVVEALEADDYSRLPPITYVRGYLRAYARLVNLPVTDVLQAFEGLRVEERSQPLTSKVGSTRGHGLTGVSAGSSWLLTLAFAAVLISGWMFWTQGQSKPETAVLDEDGSKANAVMPARATEVGTMMPAPATSASVPEILESSTDTGIDLPVLSDATAVIVAQPPAQLSRSDNLSAPVDKTADNVDAASVQASQQNASVASTPSSKPEIAEQSPSVMATTANANPEPRSSPRTAALETLKVDVTGKSWIAVQDAGGQRLVYGLLERGDSRRVTGRPPFDITIGDATQVILHHDGARVDLDPYTRGKVARFTLTATRD